MKKPLNAKNTMLLHSEAKIEFYRKYLERYLRILHHSPWINAIYIFDIFCGTGIYENNKKGSPLVAFESIKNLRAELGNGKHISLIVNDSKAKSISAVKTYIEELNTGICEVEYYNLSADEMLENVISKIEVQDRKTRNLIFLDPYGYKEIKKEDLASLLKNDRSEIILFLPISHMQRFTVKALQSDSIPYKPLKDFVDSFFEISHPIRNQTVSSMDYIGYLNEALRFQKYYSTSYFIERDKSNYYALFFVSQHIYGFEKILEVKWHLDEQAGRGFKQPNRAPSLFDDQEKDLIDQENYLRLESILKASLETPKNNQEIYVVVLKHEFLPKHANAVLRKWAEENPRFELQDFKSGRAVGKKSFYIGWKYSKPKQDPKIVFKLAK